VRRIPAVALGYQGFGNVGDEAILGGVERILAGTSLELTAVIGGDRAPIPAAPTAERVLSHRLLPTPSAIRALRRARVLLLAGGGLIHDHWPIVVIRYLAWSLLARMLRRRVVWLGVGVGPLRRRWARAAAWATVRLAHLVTVRDPGSLELVQRIAPGTVVEIVPDPAFFLEPPSPRRRAGLALIVREPVPRDRALRRRAWAALAGFAAAWQGGGDAVTVLCMERDLAVARGVARLIERAGRQAQARALPIDPAQAAAELATFEAAVSMRLHGLILCALAGTPCVPIGYDPKVAGTATLLGIGELVAPLRELEAADVARRLAVAVHPETRERVRACLETLAAQRSAVAGLVERYARG
jgi:polysaccharide pyruvyl transferase CsaB